jgi:indole-3-glycerol phosphate synthase
MSAVPDVLSRIVARKRAEIAAREQHVPLDEIIRAAHAAATPGDFAGALRTTIAGGRAAVIAEVKKASPSAGVIRADFDPEAIARSYAAGGACCLSVLTDVDFFHGHDGYLGLARAACALPVLRKDFMLSPYQIYESRMLGADCVLLIAAILDCAEMRMLAQLAHELGMTVLAEVHGADELPRAIDCGAALIGINNRDLRVFKTDLNTTLRLKEAVPADRLVVTESGIQTRAHVAMMRSAGVHAFLIGESLMREPDPGAALRALMV